MPQIVEWAKRNKVAAAAIAGGGALLLTRHGSGGTSVTDSSGGTTGDATAVQLIPVTSGPSESAGTVGDGLPGDTTGDTGGDIGGSTGGDTVPPDTPIQEAAPPAPSPAPAPAQTATPNGITIAGKFFSGAIGSSIVSSGTNSNGHYTTHLLRYPAKSERWNHYSSGKLAGKWVGPFGGNVTASGGGSGGPPSPAPAPAPAPATHSQTIHGKVFSNLLSASATGAGSNSNGHYEVWTMVHPANAGGTNHWNYYTSGSKRGQWVGPYG